MPDQFIPPEKAARKQGSRFRPGVSGNPSGRPVGARNRATLAVEALLDGQAEALTQKAVELALDGDVVALRLCLKLICPPRKDRAVAFALPEMSKSLDVADAMGALMVAVAAGDIAPPGCRHRGRAAGTARAGPGRCREGRQDRKGCGGFRREIPRRLGVNGMVNAVDHRKKSPLPLAYRPIEVLDFRPKLFQKTKTNSCGTVLGHFRLSH